MDQVPILFRHLVENDITKDAGIVYHGVDLAKGPNGILNDGFGAVPFRNRMEARYGDSASGGDRIDGTLCRGFVGATSTLFDAQIGNQNVGTRDRKSQHLKSRP